MMNVEERKAIRYRFLQQLYDDVDGSTLYMADMWEIGQKLGLDRRVSDDVVNYLIDEGLLKSMALGGGIAITHFGVKEIEQANSNPEKPTEHFPAINIINVGNMSHSVLQQGTTSSQVTYTLSQEENKNLQDIIKELDTLKETIDLHGEVMEEFISELNTLKSQSTSPKPKKAIIRESLNTIRSISEGLVTNALSSNIAHYLSNL